MPRQTPSASDYTSVVRSSAVANDVASKPAGSPGAAKAAAAAVRGGGGLGSLGAIGSIVKQSVVAKSIAPPVVRIVTIAPAPVVVEETVSTFVVPSITPFAIESQNESIDTFIVKYDTLGKAQWSARISSSGTVLGLSVTTDLSGNVYVTGQGGNQSASNYLIVFNSDGTAYSRPLPNQGWGDAFIVKYNPNGIVQWVARIACENVDIGYSITTDLSGNVYVGGQGGSNLVITAINSNGTPFGTTISNTSLEDAFLVKYNTNGFVQWVTRVASTDTDTGFALTTDSNGDIYYAGRGGSGAVVTAHNSNGTSFATTIANSGGTDGFIVKYNTNGFVQWVARVASAGADVIRGLATDSNNNLYVIGSANDLTAAFNSNSASFATTLTHSGNNDIFVMKYNSTGFVQWVTRIASGSTELGFGIATDPNGNVYITGQTNGTPTVFNSDGSTFGTISNTRERDIIIVKYNTNGTAQWAAKIGSSSADMGYAISTDSGGNVYVTGQGGSTDITAFNANGTEFGTLIPPVGSEAAVVVKYNTNGVVQWATHISSPNTDIGFGIATDFNGNSYVTGQYQAGFVSLYGSALSLFSTLPTSGASDAFIVKYSTSGSPQWVARVASAGTDIGYGISNDSLGNVYVTGEAGSGVATTAFNSDGSPFETTLSSAGGTDAFIVKYNTSGFVQWVAKVASTGTDGANAITTDSAGNSYITGRFSASGSATMTAFSSNGSEFATTLANAGLGDVFIVKYDTSGIVQWVARVGSTQPDIGYGITTDSSGNVYVTGQGGSGAVVTAFSFNGVPFGTTLSNAGNTDAFIVKYNTSGIVQWVTRVASTAADIGYAIATDPLGNVYVTGQGGSGSVVTAYNSDSSSFATKIANSGNNDAFVIKYNTNGVVQWVTRISSTSADIGFAIATDSSGNVYVTGQGSTGSQISIFSSDGTSLPLPLQSSGFADVFIVKYDTNGIAQWASRIASASSDIGYSIKTDSAGNVYVATRTGVNSEITIFNSDTTVFANAGTSLGLVKFNTNGFAQWFQMIGGTSFPPDNIAGLTVDTNGNSYITGGTPFGGVTQIYAGGNRSPFRILDSRSQDAYVMKHAPDGSVLWFAPVGGLQGDSLTASATDTLGNLYAVGTGGSATITVYNSNLSTFGTIANTGGGDVIVLKYDTTGNALWTAKIATINADTGIKISVDTAGNVYVLGQCGSGTGTVFNSTGTSFATTIPSGSGFLVKYNSNGLVQWVVRFATAVNTMFTDSSGNSYIGGTFSSLTLYNFNGSPFARTLTSKGGTDAFVAKYDTDGFVQWVSQVGGLGTEGSSAITSDSSGNVYIAGQGGAGSASFNAYSSDDSMFTTAIPNDGNGDAFLVKYNSAGFVQWVTRVGSPRVDTAFSLATDSSGNVFMSGGASGNGQAAYVYNSNGSSFGSFNNGAGNRGYLVKYNTSGSVQWFITTTSDNSETINNVFIDSSGDFYISAFSSYNPFRAYNVDGTSFTSSYIYRQGGIASQFLIKYRANGTVQWVYRMDKMNINGISVDSSSNLYSCGSFTSSFLIPYSA
jgi:hypothetical protein